MGAEGWIIEGGHGISLVDKKRQKIFIHIWTTFSMGTLLYIIIYLFAEFFSNRHHLS